MSQSTDSQGAARDLEFIRGIVQRTDRRIDPHAFHFVHWGVIVPALQAERRVKQLRVQDLAA
jgi:hypothetical protein